jgi:valyl-tRNA synthetase
MHDRYENWVRGLSWDWAISRQRYFGVPFPIWSCEHCGATSLADESQLPLDPSEISPLHPCPDCGGTDFTPETDVMDTWATSSNSPQIAGRWLAEPELYRRVFPMSLRPQAHDIIRTWAFYTIVKSLYHFDELPWTTVAISGHGLSAAGEKISKSRDNARDTPLAMMERYSADAIRYWAAGAGFGRDSWISEDQFKIGQKLITKLWNVFRFSMTFLADYRPSAELPAALTPTDRWLLARLQQTIEQTTAYFEGYDFARAKTTTEDFFWNVLADNYLEMAKLRLYERANSPESEAARYTLYHALASVLKLLAPIMPHITEEIYQHYFAQFEQARSIHQAIWPAGHAAWGDVEAEAFGEEIIAIATEVRRYKSNHQLSLGAEFAQLILVTDNKTAEMNLRRSYDDLQSVTRAREIVLDETGSNGTAITPVTEKIGVGIVA